ncbi:MAG TPA: membrane protein insertase YidC [bacterium]
MNPEQRRLIFAFAAIVVVMFLWTMLSKPPARKSMPAPTDQTSTVPGDTARPVLPGSAASVIPQDTITVERDAYRLILTSAGASVQGFYLKKYKVNIVPDNSCLFVSENLKDGKAVVFTPLVTDDSVVFTHDAGKVAVRKVYHFDKPDGFSLAMTAFDKKTGASIDMDSVAAVMDLRAGLRITELQNRGDDLRYFGVYAKTSKVVNITKEIKDELDYAGAWEWLAFRNKYFLLAIRNLGTMEQTTFFKLPAPAVVKKTTAGFGCAFMSAAASVYGAQLVSRRGFDLCVILLPLRQADLARYGQGFEHVLGGGIWGPIARVILLFFNLMYRLFRNYGVAIIVFAILLKAIFFPLSRQMIISQHKMQMLQPEMKKVQAKYKNDPQALNQEMMHLYKVYKVNPFSGCLPLIIQMPVFFALYQTLGTSIEFRQAPFMLWLTDLSVKDPYYVLPIGMGVMMLIQSLMTTVDPRQRLLVFLMPVFMIFIFLNLPSGLQLYWFAYNILTLLENYITKKGGIK